MIPIERCVDKDDETYRVLLTGAGPLKALGLER
jgi:hypothetical protein